MRVAVAMSGGVDSSTAAALLVEQGHEVIGLSMKTHGEVASGRHGCCTPEDLRDARDIADRLRIPFYVLNYEEVFRQEIIVPFAESYAAGLTPNPCIECNCRIKFRPLLDRAKLLSADKLATGHYARIETEPESGRFALLRGKDSRKDQSYFLYRLDQQQLSSLMFPLGDMTKDVVRAHARRLGLEIAEKSESQELCFVGPDGYAAAVETVLGKIDRPGDIVDAEGHVLGRHDGVHHYTLGQRHGLKIAAPEPLYVTNINAESATVQVGRARDLLQESVNVQDLHWLAAEPASDEVVSVQQRYRERPHPARVRTLASCRALVDFVEPTPRGAPGQAAVFYRGDRVLGGGVLVS